MNDHGITKQDANFLPIGWFISVLVIASLCCLLWYGCGWMVHSDQLLRQASDNQRPVRSGELAVNTHGGVEAVER